MSKQWSKIVDEHGVQVRIYERPSSSNIYREVRLEDGTKDRRSLRTSDRANAEKLALELCAELARARLTNVRPGEATFGEVRDIYLDKKTGLSKARRRFLETTLDLFGRFLEPNGEGFRMDDFSNPHAEAYLAARRSGELKPDDRRASDSPSDGTLRNELQALSTVCNWAVSFKVNGQRLLGHNPVKDCDIPVERNPKRPRATEARYRKLLEKADEADPEGRLRLLLVLAWTTGRRINAMVHLRASDVFFSPETFRTALAEDGEDEGLADHWPAAIRWRAEWDKKGYLTYSPMPSEAREALERYLRKNPKLGEAWLFPANEDRSEPLGKLMASYYLHAARELAELPKQKRGGWHAFRRAWATKRKHLPVQDVMDAGGWRSPEALQTAYQGSDPETVQRVVDAG